MTFRFRCNDCMRARSGPDPAAEKSASCLACGEQICPRVDSFEPGSMLGTFRIERMLGRGGMAAVYLARRGDGEDAVALKVFDARESGNAAFARLFLNEIRLHARIDHPYLVTAHEAGQAGGFLYLVMAYVPGENLHRRVMREGPLSEHDTLRLAMKLALALQYVWEEHRLVHCDVKPANVLLGEDGEPQLVDLGLARMRKDVFGENGNGAAIGTINYISPEQARGEAVDARADIFSLGATLYTAVTGRIPFDAPTVQETVANYGAGKMEDPRHWNPALSPGLALLLRGMMAVRPAHRPAAWPEARRCLGEVLEGGAPRSASSGDSMIALADQR